MKRIFEVDGAAIACAEEGDGDAFVLVHGAGANRNYWRALATQLVGRGRRALAPDLYGHGETAPWPRAAERPYSYLDDVAVLERLTAELSEPFVLVGHSSGGAVSLEFAARHPERVRKLVVLEPMLPTVLDGVDDAAFAEVAGAYRQAHDAVAAGDHERAARLLFEYILGSDEWQRLPSATRAWMVAHADCTLCAHSRASLALRPEGSRYERIRCPVLLLHGEHTRAPYRRICEVVARRLPDVQATAIVGAAHNGPLTHTREFHRLLFSFC
jgi:pimeloyl-ACP methyl ester carboxylesterase